MKQSLDFRKHTFQVTTIVRLQISLFDGNYSWVLTWIPSLMHVGHWSLASLEHPGVSQRVMMVLILFPRVGLFAPFCLFWQIQVWKLTWSSSSRMDRTMEGRWIVSVPRCNGLDGALDLDLGGLDNGSAVPGADLSWSVLSDSESNQNKNTKPSVAANEFSACMTFYKIRYNL